MIPAIGIRAAGFGFALLLLVSTLACALLAEQKQQRRLLVAAASVGAALVALLGPSVAPFVVIGELRWIDGEWQYHESSTKLLRYRTGTSGTVMVKSEPNGSRRIFIDDQPVASTNLQSRFCEPALL